MAKQTINIGSSGNDGTGDPIRDAFDKANDNFTELYDDVADKADAAAMTSALAGKANTSHTHAQSDITDLVADLAGKANASHTHSQSEVTGLTTASSPQFTALNIGHASDTTLSRSSAGNLAVEGNLLYRAGGTDVPLADGGTGASDASGARTNLGLVIGTNVQAYNANLAQFASLTDPNADRLLFWDDSAGTYTHLTLGTNLAITGTTLNASGSGGGLADGDYGDVVVSGSGTAIAFDSGVVTTFARTFLDDADAAAVRTTLGVATTSLSANQRATVNSAGNALEARTDKVSLALAFEVTEDGTYILALWPNIPVTLTEVSACTLSGTCSIKIQKGGVDINGFGSAVALTTSVTDTASTEALAEDAKLTVIISSASSLTGIYLTFKGVRTGN